MIRPVLRPYWRPIILPSTGGGSTRTPAAHERLLTLPTEATEHPSATALKLRPGELAVRVLTGETPHTEKEFLLHVAFDGGTPVPVRMTRWESRIITAPPGAAVAFGTADGRSISAVPMGAGVLTEADTFPVSGTANADKALPPLWEPAGAHVVLPSLCAEFEIPADTEARVVFVAESINGAVWSPPRWLRTSTAGPVRVRASFKYIALATEAGDAIPVNAPEGSTIGGTSAVLHLVMPAVTGVTHNVSNLAEFKAAIAAAVAGDQIVVADGAYAFDVNISHASFVANHTVGGKRGMEGITIRGASGDRSACVISCAGSGQGDWGIYHIASSGLAGFRDLTFDFTGSGSSGFLISRGAWAFENVHWTNSEGSKDACNFVGSSSEPGLFLDMLWCRADNSANDCFNGAEGFAGDRVRLIGCYGSNGGAADSNQALTTHTGLRVAAYGGSFGECNLNAIAPDGLTTIHCYWTRTHRTSRNCGVQGASGYGVDFTVTTAAGTGTLNVADYLMAGIVRNTIRESVGGAAARTIRGNLFVGGGVSNVAAYYPSVSTTTEFSHNVVTGWNYGIRFDASSSGSDWAADYNTLISCSAALAMTSTNATKRMRGNACKTNTNSVTSSAGAMSLTMTDHNVLDPTVSAAFVAGPHDVTGSDAALDARYYPTTGGNCDATANAADSEPVGGIDFNGAALRLSSTSKDRGALCRPRIMEGAELLPDIRF